MAKINTKQTDGTITSENKNITSFCRTEEKGQTSIEIRLNDIEISFNEEEITRIYNFIKESNQD